MAVMFQSIVCADVGEWSRLPERQMSYSKMVLNDIDADGCKLYGLAEAIGTPPSTGNLSTMRVPLKMSVEHSNENAMTLRISY